tara:strand:+ start:4666 stop:5853 length:1188 start_codon:yes stop_codon:yes gene_type:complete
MGLELNKVTSDVKAMSTTLASKHIEIQDKHTTAKNTLEQFVNDNLLQQKIAKAISLNWTGAIPTKEPINSSFECPAHPQIANIIATDGSQIYPDRHGKAMYFLINTGSIVFSHGSNEAPYCSSQPHLFYQDHDMYPNESLISNAIINAKRDIIELQELSKLATREDQNNPTVLMLDNGLLLYLGLQTRENSQSAEMLQEYLDTLIKIESTGACITGVISRPRAANVLRLLKLHDIKDTSFNEDEIRSLYPYNQLTDRMLFNFLRPGERSAIFVNASPQNLKNYMPAGQKIMFFYVNTGTINEPVILRVEVPEWVTQQPDKLSIIHSSIVEQSSFGNGYPYVLMRSHELAVVTWKEKQYLDQMISNSMHKNQIYTEISKKAFGKTLTNSVKRRHRR